jgi:2-dehydropantoate 2-reductase
VIAILGPGGVGGFLAAALARAGEPATVIAREPTAAAIARDGIAVESVRLGEFTAHPAAAPWLTEPGATLVVATKATTLEAALERVDAQPALIVPLLNGLDHMALLRERFGAERVAAGSIRIEAHRPATGRITHTSPFLRVDIGPPSRAVEELAAAFERAEVPARVLDTEAEVLWGKLVRLNAIASSTSAYDLPFGAIRDDPEKYAEAEAAVREAVAVARAEGAAIDPERVMEEIGALHPTLTSSMQRDIAAGIPPELDAIPGAVLRAAERHGIDAPAIAGLYDKIAARIA